MRTDEADFLRPLWVRVAILLAVIVWGLLEWFVWHDELFRWLILGILGYAVWSLFVDFKPKPPDDAP